VDSGLSWRTALVLGAAGGLGSAIARTLAKKGANVALADVDSEGLSKVSESVASRRVRSLPLVWDVSDLGSIAGHMDSIESTLGPVDILVNITGGPPPTPASRQDPSVWTRNFQAMVLSVIANH
jgi:3-oxoacyl-[acyl-carrier protein] reductase